MNSFLLRWYGMTAALPVVAALLYCIFLALTYKRLPAEIPVHFSFDGTPNGYMLRGLWSVLSPLMLLAIVLLVLTTQPGFGVTTILCWAAIGLVAASFFEIVRSAGNGDRFHAVTLLLGLALMPAMEALLSAGLRSWWSHPV